MKSIIHKINKKLPEGTSLVATLVALLLVSGLVTGCAACDKNKTTNSATDAKIKIDSR